MTVSLAGRINFWRVYGDATWLREVFVYFPTRLVIWYRAKSDKLDKSDTHTDIFLVYSVPFFLIFLSQYSSLHGRNIDRQQFYLYWWCRPRFMGISQAPFSPFLFLSSPLFILLFPSLCLSFLLFYFLFLPSSRVEREYLSSWSLFREETMKNFRLSHRSLFHLAASIFLRTPPDKLRKLLAGREEILPSFAPWYWPASHPLLDEVDPRNRTNLAFAVGIKMKSLCKHARYHRYVYPIAIICLQLKLK